MSALKFRAKGGTLSPSKPLTSVKTTSTPSLPPLRNRSYMSSTAATSWEVMSCRCAGRSTDMKEVDVEVEAGWRAECTEMRVDKRGKVSRCRNSTRESEVFALRGKQNTPCRFPQPSTLQFPTHLGQSLGARARSSRRPLRYLPTRANHLRAQGASR